MVRLDVLVAAEASVQCPAVEVALKLCRTAAEMPGLATAMVKEAVNATAGALNRVASHADADQSWLSAVSKDAKAAKDAFQKNKKKRCMQAWLRKSIPHATVEDNKHYKTVDGCCFHHMGVIDWSFRERVCSSGKRPVC